MTDLSPILPKLARLVPRLATDADGEVVATVRAIGRTLATAGADWHDFAASLRPALPPPDPAPRCGSAASWRELIGWCIASGEHVLCARDRVFLRDMRLLVGRGLTPTEKQAAWLRDIRRKLEGGA